METSVASGELYRPLPRTPPERPRLPEEVRGWEGPDFEEVSLLISVTQA